VNIRQLLFVRRLFKKEGPLMRQYLHGAQWLNVLALAAQVLNQALGVFPGLGLNPAVLVVQAILGALLPSFAGISHKIDGTVVVPK
jgi:hypothetical protein